MSPLIHMEMNRCLRVSWSIRVSFRLAVAKLLEDCLLDDGVAGFGVDIAVVVVR
jgi:hypothetical protein